MKASFSSANKMESQSAAMPMSSTTIVSVSKPTTVSTFSSMMTGAQSISLVTSKAISSTSAGGVMVVTVPTISSSGALNLSTCHASSTPLSSAPSSLSVVNHMHIPRGAAVVANMSNSRSSHSVTANPAHRGTHLQTRAVPLVASNWSRAANSSPSTCSTTLSSSSPSIATTKFTRMPSAQLAGRPNTSAITNASGFIRPTSITRMNSGTNILNIPSTLNRANSLSSITRVTSPATGGISRTTIVSHSVPRNVLSASRTAVSPIRTPSVSPMTNQPIRLTQTANQRSNLSSYTLTSVPQQRQGLIGNVRTRITTPSTARLPLSTNITGYTQSRPMSGQTSRPQNNPSVSTVARPVLCSSRPAAGVSQSVRAAGGVIRGTSNLSVRGAATDRPRHPQQFVTMMNSPIQKICTLSSPMSSSLATTRSLPLTNAGSISVRISPHTQLPGSGAVNIVKAHRPTEGSHHSGAVQSSAASAAAAVLPPGTTITPAVISTGVERIAPPATSYAPARAGGNLHPVTKLHPQQSYYVENSAISPSGVASLVPNSPTPILRVTPGQFSPIGRRGNEAPPPSKPSASPRPSILRKRPDMDSLPSKACKNLSASLNPTSPSPPSNGGNSEASTGSATLSANSSPGLLIEECEQPMDETSSSSSVSGSISLPTKLTNQLSASFKAANQGAVPPLKAANQALMKGVTSLPLRHTNQLLAAAQHTDSLSPRKKPRKQQLTGNELQESNYSQEECKEFRPNKKIKREHNDFDGSDSYSGRAEIRQQSGSRRRQSPQKVSPSRQKVSSSNVLTPLVNVTPTNKMSDTQEKGFNNNRKAASLLSTYHSNWNARAHHFDKHSDVVLKEPKKNPLSTPIDDKATQQKMEGWKVVHVGCQVRELVTVEEEVNGRLNGVLTMLEKSQISNNNSVLSKDMHHVCELLRASIQRSVTVQHQMNDVSSQMGKLLTHKEHVTVLLKKMGNKRQLRKKERR